ncbi:hypothetical protein [Microvirga roseola]|uniref:hypothetical protein n=1 Tax=Microvirga roseola TaxID=2883126 RepID=UPI001E5E1208|nr:hypothetical protein [Microvirga roseola]
MGQRTEFWWVLYNAEIRPAEVGFVGGIPSRIWVIGATDSIPAAAAELLERLPAPPTPIFKPAEPQSVAPPPQRSGSLLWFIGILLLIFVVQCSGPIFDAIK